MSNDLVIELDGILISKHIFQFHMRMCGNSVYNIYMGNPPTIDDVGCFVS